MDNNREVIVDSKYYTPNIEEFHVGFEYNVIDRAGYHSVVLTDTMLSQNLIFATGQVNFYSWVKGELGKGNIQVKYLDKEDIESLGFIQTDFETYNKDGIEIIWWSKESKTNLIVMDHPEFLFKGEIKNKSELKKVLQMIGVL